MPKKLAIGVFFGLFILSAASGADTIIELNGSIAPAPRDGDQRFGPERLSATRLGTKVEMPSGFYILPHYLVETTDPNGDSSLIAIRNEDSVDNEVTVQYFSTDSALPLTSSARTLSPKEVWPINLRDVLSDQPTDPDGYLRGWARILGLGPITADYFQATPSESFATGELPVDIAGGEFCELNKVRFLIGGAFSGGTILTLMLDFPLGGDSASDPPSVSGTVYNEAGAEVNTFNVWTDDFSLQLNVESLVQSGTNAGSLDLRFNNVDNGFSGGASVVTHDASGIFSVGLKGFCLDALISMGS